MQTVTFLEYRNYRYLKLAAGLLAASALGYWATQPAGGGAYGGTWFGYLLGTVCALIVLLLIWYGVRKRRSPLVRERRHGGREREAGAEPPVRDRRRKRAEDSWRYGGTLQGWLSAHAYLGTALAILVSLHAGFRMGFSIHGLAYLLVLLMVASGFYGTFAYLHYPRRIAEALGEDTLEGLALKIADLDDLARARAVGLPPEVGAAVALAAQGTRLGGSFFQRIGCQPHACPTALAVQRVQELGKVMVEGEQPRLMRDLHAVLLQKQRLVARARHAVHLTARMQVWLYVHAPLAVALLAALAVHVATILIYW